MEQTLGKRIVKHRKRLKLTQDQLAEKLGVTAQAVSKWENDLSCPDISTLPKLAQLFGVTVDSLLGHEAQPVYEAEVVQPDEDKSLWEIRFDSSKATKIGMALGILAVGIQMILCTYLGKGLSFWDLLWPTALIAYGACGLFPKFSFFRFGCFLFGGYFLLDMWQLLPLSLGSNLFFPIILVLLGLSLLMDATRKSKKPHISFKNPGMQNHNYTCDEDMFELDASFGSMHQVVAIPLLREGNIDTCFGSYTVNLTQVDAVAEDCSLDVDCSFGEITLLIPKRFGVRNTPTTAFGHVEMVGEPDTQPKGFITLQANISFGKIIIEYT